MTCPHKLVAAALLLFASVPASAAEIPLRVVGQSSNATKHMNVEREFFGSLAAKADIPLAVTFNPTDVVNVAPSDALRMIRLGTFDVISTQLGQAARDAPVIEGVDLVGVATDVPALRKSADAYREVLDRVLQDRFNAKLLTVWAFGPQIIYCNAPISGVKDLRGLKVRVFTASMAAAVESLGATAVTMPATEVYTALQRGVVDCAISSATSGNTAKWPELTTHLLPLGLAGSVQGHLVNLTKWNKFSPAEQARLTKEFKHLEDRLWALAESLNADAIACNTGRDSCREHEKYKMVLVPVTDAEVRQIHTVAEQTVLPLFKQACQKADPGCAENWNRTVGAVHGLRMK